MSYLHDFINTPGLLTYALMEKATQTKGDWHPNRSLWALSWERELEKRDSLKVLAARALVINQFREAQEKKQVPMPADFKSWFGPKDDVLGKGDENHRMVGMLTDMALILAESPSVSDRVVSKQLVGLVQKIVVDYADDKDSYLSYGGVKGQDGKPIKYLGDTGRWRKFAMIVRMLFDVLRIYKLDGWTLPQNQTLILGWNLLHAHFELTIKDIDSGGMLEDNPKADHLPRNKYVSLFQMALAYHALKRVLELPGIPQQMAVSALYIMDFLRTWMGYGIKRDESGTIVGAYYDVPFPNAADVATVDGNVPFIHPVTGAQEKAHDGMGVALHLATIFEDFDAFLKVAKADELSKFPALRTKFELD